MANFRKALLLYNPVSGARIDRRSQAIAEVEHLLHSTGAQVVIEPTHHAGSAGKQAQKAISGGCDAVFACGGDGTILDVLQGVVGTEATLGVVPLGTGNVLATDLGLPRNTRRAMQRLLTYESRRVAVGKITCNEGALTRYFTVCGGVGVHAELIYRSTAKAKQARGPSAYYLAGFELLFRHEFVPFEIEYTDLRGEVHRERSLEIVAMRVSSFGGLLSRFRPGSGLDTNHFELILLQKSTRLAMFRYTLQAIAGGINGEDRSYGEDVRFVRARHVVCKPVGAQAHRVRVQADGELLGIMPAEITLVPDALNLLMPAVRR
ncbi:MAG TPA: diacylglycerol kinase family protein [Candidatus Acidoferrales bacterium]|nr:diacylglycerol kinase family protein [Candidatus Acidoferrales bacterium]